MSEADVFGEFVQQHHASFDGSEEHFRVASASFNEDFLLFAKNLQATEIYVNTSMTYIESLKKKIGNLKDSICQVEADLNSVCDCITESERRVVILKAKLQSLFSNSYYERFDVSNRNEGCQCERKGTDAKMKSSRGGTNSELSDVLFKYALESNINLDNYDISVEKKRGLVFMILQSKEVNDSCSNTNIPRGTNYIKPFNSTPNMHESLHSGSQCSPKIIKSKGNSVGRGDVKSSSFSQTYVKTISDLNTEPWFRNKTFKRNEERYYVRLPENESGKSCYLEANTPETSSDQDKTLDDLEFSELFNILYLEDEPLIQVNSTFPDVRLTRKASESGGETEFGKKKSTTLQSAKQLNESLREMKDMLSSKNFNSSTSERELIPDIETQTSVKQTNDDINLINFSGDSDSVIKKIDEEIPSTNEGKNLKQLCITTESTTVASAFQLQNRRDSFNNTKLSQTHPDNSLSQTMSCRPKIFSRSSKKFTRKKNTRRPDDSSNSDVTLSENTREVLNECSNPRNLDNLKANAQQTLVKKSKMCRKNEFENDNLQTSDSNKSVQNLSGVGALEYTHKKFRTPQYKRAASTEKELSSSSGNLNKLSLRSRNEMNIFPNVDNEDERRSTFVTPMTVYASSYNEEIGTCQSQITDDSNNSCHGKNLVSSTGKVFFKKGLLYRSAENATIEYSENNSEVFEEPSYDFISSTAKVFYPIASLDTSSDSTAMDMAASSRSQIRDSAEPLAAVNEEQTACGRHAAARSTTCNSAEEFEKRVLEGVFKEFESKSILPQIPVGYIHQSNSSSDSVPQTRSNVSLQNTDSNLSFT